MANSSYGVMDHHPDVTTEREPMRPAYDRFHAKWEMPEEFGRVGEFQLRVIRAVVAAMDARGVPDDAYVNWNYPYAFANWERPVG